MLSINFRQLPIFCCGGRPKRMNMRVIDTTPKAKNPSVSRGPWKSVRLGKTERAERNRGLVAKRPSPHPRCFLSKSAQDHEKKRVVIFATAKKSKKMQKSAQGYEKKGDRVAEIGDGGSEESAPPIPPAMMHEYQKKRLIKFAFRKRLILKVMFLVVQRAGADKYGPRRQKSGSKLPHSK